MEAIVSVLLEVFADGCCQLLVAGVFDLFAGIAGYKTHQRRAEAIQKGEPLAPPDGWTKAYKILLPIAIVLSLGMVGFQIWVLAFR